MTRISAAPAVLAAVAATLVSAPAALEAHSDTERQLGHLHPPTADGPK